MGYEFARGTDKGGGAESKMMHDEGLSSFQKMVEVSKVQAGRIVDEETAIMNQLKSDDDFQTIVSYEEFKESSEADVLAAKYIDLFPHIDDSQERAALIVAVAKAEVEKKVH